MSELIVRALASERYSQVTDLIAFEDHLDNSLQHDLMKIEHVRMRLAHEVPSTELADTKLIELKFFFEYIHSYNREFEVLSDYKPRGQPTFDARTLMINSSGTGSRSSCSSISSFFCSQAASTRPSRRSVLSEIIRSIPENKIPLKERIHVRKEAEFSEMTADERTLFDYISALRD
ncbi:hypothetical protein DFH11DRAFT_1727053 [Phellopilus nigrolimitatus]|nr:hypothetical protein DFH11DRAFT_1727053 [Phellopilus nigrolimitatus]